MHSENRLAYLAHWIGHDLDVKYPAGPTVAGRFFAKSISIILVPHATTSDDELSSSLIIFNSIACAVSMDSDRPI